MLMPTTSVAVYRASGEPNEWGDDTDSTTEILFAAVPAAVVEDGQLRFAPADLRADLVEQFTVRVPSAYRIRENDRLVDGRTGDTYQVQGVSTPQSLIGPTSTRLTCKRIGTTA